MPGLLAELDHLLCRRLHTIDHAEQVDAVNRLKLLLRHVEHRLDLAYAGVVDHGIQRAELIYGIVNQTEYLITL